MVTKFSFWLRIAILFQLLTGLIHSLSLLSDPSPNNELEEEMFRLMNEVEINFGSGFFLTMNDIVFAFSVCFSLFLFFTAILNFIILKFNEIKLIKSIVIVNILFYSICFVVMLFYTFLPPIICTFLILFSLIITLFILLFSERIKS